MIGSAKLRRLMEETRVRGRASVWRARACARRADVPAAIRHMEAAIFQEPDCAWRFDLELDRLSGREDAVRVMRRVDELLRRPRPLNTAEALASKRRRGFPPKSWLWTIRGETLRLPHFNRPTEAIKEFERAFRAEPRSAWIATLLGRSHFNSGSRKTGMKYLSRSVELAPTMGWGVAWRGEARRFDGDIRGAKADFERAIEVAPEYPWSYAWLGGVFSALGRYKDTCAYLDLFLSVIQVKLWAFYVRADARRRLGDIPGCVADLKRTARGDLNVTLLGAGGRLKPEQVRRYRAAVRDFGAYLRRKPRYAWAHAWRGEARIRLGQYRPALADLDAALGLSPRLSWAHAWRAESLVGLGEYASAEEAVAKAIRLEADYPRAFALRAWLRRRRGDFRGAVTDFGKAAGPQTSSAWCAAWRGEALLQAGDPRAAAAELDRAIELDPLFADAYAWRGEALRRMGRRGRARRDFDRALEIRPGHQLALVGRGLSAGAAGDFRASARDLAVAVPAEEAIVL
ncbi:MAG: tetratricopeptide repeat protein [Elusimicrobiota bacterium]